MIELRCRLELNSTIESSIYITMSKWNDRTVRGIFSGPEWVFVNASCSMYLFYFLGTARTLSICTADRAIARTSVWSDQKSTLSYLPGLLSFKEEWIYGSNWRPRLRKEFYSSWRIMSPSTVPLITASTTRKGKPQYIIRLLIKYILAGKVVDLDVL